MATRVALFPRGRSMSRGTSRVRPRSRSSQRSNATMRSRSRSLGRVTVSAKSTPSRRPRQRRRRNPRKPVYPGGDYTGKLPKPRPYRSDKKLLTGAAGTSDYCGVFAEEHCGHIGFSSVEPYEAVYAAVQTMCRHYLTTYLKASISDGLSQVFPGTANGLLWNFVLYYNDKTPAAGAGTYQDWPRVDSNDVQMGATAATTFDTVVGNVFNRVIALFAANNDIEFTAFEMGAAGVANGPVGVSGPDTLYKMDLSKTKLRFTNVVRYRLQNQTVGDSGGTTQDDIRSNPIVGKIYKHNTPVPLMHDLTTQYTGSTSYWGTCNERRAPNGNIAVPRGTIAPFIVQANVFQTATKIPAMQRPPSPDVFRTCSKVTTFGLNPGEMKQGQLVFKYYGDFSTFVRNLLNTYNGIVTNDSFGTCHTLAFSKRMPTGANTVVYSFDRHSSWSATLKRRLVSFKSGASIGNVVSATV